MNRIKILPEHVANQIAAGEVVERPASVVKELVENAIDANASQITIEIKGAGKKYIRVADNGSGMTRADAELAVERFATSKLESVSDLTAIKTLGFRGEALPSIASVSKFELVTRSEESISGTKIIIEGGMKKEITEIGAPVGTTVKVQNLFYNTPARLKFLKSDTTETAQIIATVSHLALGYPQIYFKLLIDGKEIYNLPPVSEILGRIIAIFGKETESELIPLPSPNMVSACVVSGYIAKPSLSRNNWSGFMSYVNRRFVSNRTITRAVFDGYHTLLPVQRYPVGVLFISIDPKLVDVNVHPTKREVRFVHEKEIYETILETIRFALHQVMLIPDIKEPIEKEMPSSKPQIPHTLHIPKSKPKEPEPKIQTQFAITPTIPESVISTSQDTVPSPQEKPRELNIHASPVSQSTLRILQSETKPSEFPQMEPLAQLDETYILCRSGEDLLIIDQHAAHERILYDRLMPKIKNQESITQLLLFPQTIELPAKEATVLAEYKDELQKYGFELDHLGGNTYTLRAVPEIVVDTDYRQLILDIIDNLTTIGKKLPTEEIQERMVTFLVCRAAVKSGDIQQMPEWKKLIYDLQNTTSPYTCPHGRPTAIRLSKEELEKRFKRT
ncbi:MAG: DNA mismatch repair endonuclease MutL [bacterium]|nr:DNA mismatch repair endonuclease MutL [bacterium]